MSHTTYAVTIAAVAIGAASAWLAYVTNARRGPVRALLAAAGLGVVLSILATIVLAGRGLDEWGFVHLLYLVVTISLPIVGVTLLVAWRRSSSVLLLVVGILLIVPAPLGAYATHIEPHRLRTDVFELPVDDARAGSDSVRIGVLADLQTNHIGAYENAAVDRLLATEPDVILVPGDLFQGDHDEFIRELEPLRELLSRLHAPGGVFFVQGDSDQWWRMQQVLPGTGLVPLVDEIADVQIGDRRLRIGGTRLHYDSRRSVEMIDELAAVDEETGDDGTIRILLSHRPDVVEELEPGSRVDLVVAGHTHGGQIVLPFIGPPVTLSDVPRDVARGGLHTIDGNEILVSPGVGLVRGQAPQVRFLSRPAIAVVDLT